ncbi:MAG: CDP-alcohol phosphatidyltransferase family protein [Alphaproteobacteria bacterium]|nr:CDP-alcohol phosphatidyltransferase family protein [Alphaproteobacteria bacterium]
MNLPNVISLGRLFVAPATVWLILDGHDVAALVLFVLAGISDAVDGAVAKQFGCVTELGGYLDPLADKALLLGAYLSLAARDALPIWLVILVVSRDILIVGGALLVHVLTRRLAIAPALISKVNTFMQIALAASILADLAIGLDLAPLSAILIWLVAATTTASGVAYVIRWSRTLLDAEAGNP